jgi:uncharacterized membrane protein YbaN (DUF454 family)
MEAKSSSASRHSARIEPHASGGQQVCLDVEIDEEAGAFRVYDPRAFRAARRGFCRRLIDAVSAQQGFGKAEVDLPSATCRIEFDPGSTTSRAVAEAFCRAVRLASADHRTGWWPERGWSALTAYRVDGRVSTWETVELKPGRIRLRHQGLRSDRNRLSRLADRLAGVDGVTDCRVSSWSRTLIIEFGPDSSLAAGPVDAVERALEDEDPNAAGSNRRRPGGGPFAVATGLKRPLYLACAGGAFAATLVALVVPGIPTVPCLLATSYFLARSSPRLDERLRRSWFFGPILDEWERWRGLSRSSKGKLFALTGAIIVITVILTPLSPVALVLILVASSASIYGIARLPTVSDGSSAVDPLDGRAHLALPAPST